MSDDEKRPPDPNDVAPGQEPGEKPRREAFTDLGELRVFEAIFPPRTAMPDHEHPHPRFGFLLNGLTDEVMPGGELLLSENMFSYHPGAMQHANRSGTAGARLLMIEMALGVPEDLLPVLPDPTTAFVMPLDDLRGVAMEIRRELHATDRARTTSLEGLTLELLTRAARLIERSLAKAAPDPSPPQWLEQARRLIDLHLDSPLSARTLADRLQLTQRELAKAFRKHLDVTFTTYLRRARLRRAMVLLRDTDQSIADAALAAGFCDQSHLANSFRREVGVTPTEYRAAIRRFAGRT
ncbi:MAG TPA: AraC family transcriptional regulator [Thermoanaerobaculia bacterium]|nr:AraC family transcriptional regulator [Thermoanaerobaculia bacterium]